MLKIIYFDARGRIEPARFMLETAGVPYEYVANSLEEWDGEAKQRALETTPLGQLPMLQDRAFTLCQSQAILRYLARKLDFHGSNLQEAARIDEVADTANEIFLEMAVFFWNPQFAELRAEHRETMGKKLELVDRYFTRAGADAEHWIVPGRCTMADFSMAYTLETVMTAHPGLLEDFPRLHRAMNAVFAIEGVRRYVRSDRRPRTVTVPLARFAGKPEETYQWTD